MRRFNLRRRASASGERGNSFLSLIFWLLVFIGFLYIGKKFLPPYTANYQFQDAMSEEAKWAASGRKTDAEVRAALEARARELDIPVKRDDIRITRMGGELTISTRYRVSIPLLFNKVYRWNFNPSAKQPLLFQ